MTTITARINNQKDAKVIQEVLERFGIEYTVDDEVNDYIFTKAELLSFQETQNKFLKGEITARDWKDIENDLNSAHD